MSFKWQWFLGGRAMFWIASVLLVVFVFIYVATFVIDPTTSMYMKVQSVDETSIRKISESYVKNLGIKIDKPICYRFVKYTNEDRFKRKKGDNSTVILGTFHEWNGTYYIDISMNVYKMSMFHDVVVHETRHMIVQELRNKRIINLDKYTEEIAEQENKLYDDIFNSGVNLLKEIQKEENKNGKI